MINKGGSSEYGKRYGIGSIRTYEEFNMQVPVVNYEEFFPQVEKVLSGDSNIIWPGKIKWFAKSSGTTDSKSKFIPVSTEALEDCHYKAGKDMLSLYLNNNNDSKLLAGKCLRLGGSGELYENNNSPELAATLASNNLVSSLGYNPYGVDQPVNKQGDLVASPAWNTDWKKTIINENAYKVQHGVSVSGGGEKTSFYFGSNYLKEEGQVKTTYFERVATRLKVDTQVKEFIETGLNISYTSSKQNSPNQSGSAFSNSIQWIYSKPL